RVSGRAISASASSSSMDVLARVLSVSSISAASSSSSRGVSLAGLWATPPRAREERRADGAVPLYLPIVFATELLLMWEIEPDLYPDLYPGLYPGLRLRAARDRNESQHLRRGQRRGGALATSRYFVSR